MEWTVDILKMPDKCVFLSNWMRSICLSFSVRTSDISKSFRKIVLKFMSSKWWDLKTQFLFPTIRSLRSRNWLILPMWNDWVLLPLFSILHSRDIWETVVVILSLCKIHEHYCFWIAPELFWTNPDTLASSGTSST